MSRPLKNGDLVVCLYDAPQPHSWLHNGHVYKVHDYDEHAVAIKSPTGEVVWFGADRFENAWGMSVETTVTPSDKVLKAVRENVRGAIASGDATEADMVNLPAHYTRFKIEPIRFGVENFGPGVLVAKIVKYASRYECKERPRGPQEGAALLRHAHQVYPR